MSLRILTLTLAVLALTSCDYQHDVEGVVLVHFQVERVEVGSQSWTGTDHVVLTTDGRVYKAADDTWVRLAPRNCYAADFLSHNVQPLIENIRPAACGDAQS